MSGVHDDSLRDDPVEAYLDRLLVTLPGSPRRVRHTLAEVEAHLYDAVAQGLADGLDERTARQRAVERIGAPAAATDGPAIGLRLTPARRRRLALGTLLVGSVGGIAIGIAGVLGALARAIWGDSAIGTPFPVGSYSSSDCARWLHLYPDAPNCVTAMTADHAADFLRNAGAAGVLGVLGLVGYLLLRRRWASREVATALPRGLEEVVGAVLATLVAVVSAAQGVDAVAVNHGHGAGAAFVLAIAAVAAAAVFGGRAVAVLRRPLLTG